MNCCLHTITIGTYVVDTFCYNLLINSQVLSTNKFGPNTIIITSIYSKYNFDRPRNKSLSISPGRPDTSVNIAVNNRFQKQKKNNATIIFVLLPIAYIFRVLNE